MDSFFDISHHGAINGVTGSCHELRLSGGPGLLVDCGLFQGAETSGKGAGASAVSRHKVWLPRQADTNRL
jgi:hypothetical protein